MYCRSRLVPLVRSLSLGLVLVAAAAWAQEKSVNPTINAPYKDPNVKEFLGKFEVESREAFAHRKEILAACRLKPGMIVADVGAGTGLFTRMMAAEVGPTGQIYAIDITPKFLEHIKKTCEEAHLANVKTVLCHPDSVDLAPASVDFAFICDVYHHFEFPQKTMTSIHRALRPGGQLVLVEFRRVQGKTPEWLMKHVRAGQEVFTKEIEDAGFKLVEEISLLKENYVLRFQRKDCP
jgi:predicted methyltransferase